MELVDRYGRVINYLRISVTDRCNFRCVYCMPAEGIPGKLHTEILRYEEITEIVRIASELGIHRIRLTGGEPLVRKNLSDLIGLIAALPGIEDISLTTNAFLLAEQAGALATAGLRRVNISLDTLNEARFSRLTRGGSLAQVLRGIKAAQDAGMSPIKINSIMIRGVNDDELESHALLTMDHDWQVRFIELMPLENSQDWGADFPKEGERYVSIQEMRDRLAALNLMEMFESNGNGPARVYRIPGGKGTIGFISPLGEHFCQTCNRLRLTADGSLRSCLLNNIEIPIRDVLRAGEDIRPYFLQAVARKPEGHLLSTGNLQSNRKMAEIGG
ncbi:MAG TPA: GTP 3',8-cyclase MoaA [Anaerolineaceae bacterium]|nr:GTP 3',8-cyclase MoaA [Anaerolineaceae bacterium]